MGFAAAGLLPPAWGALLQEAIDLAVIANALRVLRPHEGAVRMSAEDAALVAEFTHAHDVLRPDLDRLRRAADHIGDVPSADSLREIRDVHRFLSEEVEPHELAEGAVLYPVFDRVIGGTDPTGTMSRAHSEIVHLVHRLGALLDDADPLAPDQEDLLELRRVLYGLHAILRLHFAQEDESYLSLVGEPDATRAPRHG
jgi:iron-sulfur cluster repair protein YtfE (RIC family)